MPRIDSIFKQLRSEGKGALMPFLTAGYPSLHITREVLPRLEQAGASIVEIGFPFSDPIADGPTIAASMHQALQSGATPAGTFDLIAEVRPSLDLGLVAMVSCSIVNRVGPEHFIQRSAAVGFDGLIIPDADTGSDGSGSATHLAELATDAGLSCSFLIAPTTSTARLESLVGLCSGFVYLLARVGLTGEQAQVPDMGPRVKMIRQYTDLPVAVGFGISTPEHVRAVTSVADAAIVGSALVRRMGDAADPVEAASSFVQNLASGLTAPVAGG